MTLAEFLVWDDATDTRYELIDGVPVSMAPPADVHGTLVIALAAEIRNQLRPPCRVVGEAGVVPVHRSDTYFQADLVVTCTPISRDHPWPRDPLVVVEVLSPSTQGHDRSGKLDAYRRLPTVRDVLLVWSTARRVEHWRRDGDVWGVQDIVGGGALALAGVPVVVQLDAIYEGIELG